MNRRRRHYQQFPTTVYFINRLDGGFNTRINASGNPGVLNLVAPNNTIVSTRNISSTSVSWWSFPNMAQAGPIYPSPTSAFQLSTANQVALVRYVRIAARPAACLFFREVFVLDVTLANVALYKNTTASVASYADPTFGGFTSFPAYGVDGVVDMDSAAGNMVNFPCDGSGWWQVRCGVKNDGRSACVR